MPKDSREEEEKKPKFKIVDKRHGAGEEEADSEPVHEIPARETAAEESPPEEIEAPPFGKEEGDEEKTELTEEEKEQVKREAERSLKFSNTVIFILRTLSEQTWIHLGLIPNPLTSLTVKNLEEARKAIDLYEHIAKFVESEYDDAIKREINTLLTDLKLNYTKQLGV